MGAFIYIDDSKATNPGSVIAALRSFDDGQSFSSRAVKPKAPISRTLAEPFPRARSAVVLIGAAAEDMANDQARQSRASQTRCMHAVDGRVRLAKPADIVLLSPGCASFDMFESAEARGETFVAAVKRLERGTEAVH